MPELPEVEVVRRGLARWVTGAAIGRRRGAAPAAGAPARAGPADFADRLRRRRVLDVVRRGKFLWLPLDSGEALLAHLGMSGQLLLQPAGRARRAAPAGPVGLDAGGDAAGRELRFVDQRMFGGLSVVPLVPTPDGLPAGAAGSATSPRTPRGRRPAPCCRRRPHRPRPARPAFDAGGVRRAGCAGRRPGSSGRCSTRRWSPASATSTPTRRCGASRLHYARPTETLTRPRGARLLDARPRRDDRGARRRAARASTASTSTSTGRAGTSTGRWPSTARRAGRARGAGRRCAGTRS